MRARTSECARQRIARLLDDPKKLQELRQQRAERKAEKSERQQQSKGRLLEHANLGRPGCASDDIAIAVVHWTKEVPGRLESVWCLGAF